MFILKGCLQPFYQKLLNNLYSVQRVRVPVD